MLGSLLIYWSCFKHSAVHSSNSLFLVTWHQVRITRVYMHLKNRFISRKDELFLLNCCMMFNNIYITTSHFESNHISHELLSWPRQITLAYWGIFWIHTQKHEQQDVSWKIYIHFLQCNPVYTQQWHSTSGSHAGHNH